MAKFPLDADSVTAFIDLCRNVKVISPKRTTATKDNIEVPILYLDRLWQKPKQFNILCELTKKALDELTSHMVGPVDGIAIVNSLIGTIGPIPVMGFLMKEFTLEGYIIKETMPGEYSIYPHQENRGREFNKKRVIIFMDGIVRGSSLVRAIRTIEKFGGSVSGILLFVDFDNPVEEAKDVLTKLPTIEFLTGEDILKIKE